MGGEDSQILFILFSGVFLAAVMATFVVAMVILHRQRQVQNKQKVEQLKVEFEKTMLNIENEIQQETLNHIGRELHDNIGQLLSLSKLYLGSSKPERQAEGKELISKTITEVRSLSKSLNLDWVENLNLEEFIQEQLDKIEASGYCKTEFVANHLHWEPSKEQKMILIRVIQECLNNAIKHASPETITIILDSSGTEKFIQIKDDGKGFDTSIASTGSGMTNLKKRMETIGGKFHLQSIPGKGTEIKLLLPV